MPEIVFSCDCGLMLKVFGEDQSGSPITCPSCKETVVVPAVGMAKATPSATVAAEAAAGHGTALVIAYLTGTVLITAGLVKFLLLPALERQAVVARAVPAEVQTDSSPAKPIQSGRLDPAGDPISKSEAARKAEAREAARADALRELAEREAAEREAADTIARARGTASKKATGPGDFFPPPTGPDPGSSPREAEIPPSPGRPGRKSDSKSAEASPYASVLNKDARTNLELARTMLNRRDSKLHPTVVLFLESAEKAGVGDPTVRREVKKLRDKLAEANGRGR